ncbi:hypothetical protein [Clostridium sp.]|uniref:hypothetical protein n=1 Tax=Clostridium sp. TaxID=1506 RepID=UPI0025BF102A|nr:hypothetical protein [Clostridium sp.]
MDKDFKPKIDLHNVLEKEINLIQSCINRMSQNSFYLKGWLVSLVGILLALKPTNLILINICLIIISISFWYLNATYLRYEKQYRELYNWVIKERLKGNNKFLYSLDINRFDKNVDSRIKIMFKNTTLCFYGTITLILCLLLVILIYNQGGTGVESFIKWIKVILNF